MSDDDPELAMIRRKKMAEMIQREKQLQATKEHQEKVDNERGKLLNRFLEPEAKTYLESLKASEPHIASKIEEIILYLIVYRGVREMFSSIDVRYIERQIKGEEPKIRVQRDGEVSDFGAYVKEALKKGSD